MHDDGAILRNAQNARPEVPALHMLVALNASCYALSFVNFGTRSVGPAIQYRKLFVMK